MHRVPSRPSTSPSILPPLSPTPPPLRVVLLRIYFTGHLSASKLIYPAHPVDNRQWPVQMQNNKHGAKDVFIAGGIVSIDLLLPQSTVLSPAVAIDWPTSQYIVSSVVAISIGYILSLLSPVLLVSISSGCSIIYCGRRCLYRYITSPIYCHRQ